MIKKILWINNFASFLGGAEKYIYETVKELKERDVQSYLLYSIKNLPNESFTNLFEGVFPAVNPIEQVLEIDPDIIYIQSFHNFAHIKLLLSLKIPIVKFYHDHEMFCLRGSKIKTISGKTCTKDIGLRCYPCGGFVRKKEGNLKFQTLAGLRSRLEIDKEISGYIVSTNYMKNQLERYGFIKNKIFLNELYLYNLHEKTKVQKDFNRILFAGQLIRGKGLDLLLSSLSKSPSNLVLDICGEGKLREEMERLSVRLSISNRVHFHGHLSAHALYSLYERASVVVMPSQVPETFALSGLDARAYNCLIFAADVGGISHWLVPGESGALFKTGSIKELADLFRRYNEGEFSSLMQNMEYTREDFINRYDKKRHVNKLLNSFSKIMDGQ
ncbi:MAG: glycosyltransferase family 4 protein [Bdellovibrionales bacterium]|nr:glycosyltransferase family 4 protein [Bdellovibrionales bacterium]